MAQWEAKRIAVNLQEDSVVYYKQAIPLWKSRNDQRTISCSKGKEFGVVQSRVNGEAKARTCASEEDREDNRRYLAPGVPKVIGKRPGAVMGG